jgi:aminoglycoside phosphotransferase (APT) family kinase protein
MGAAANAETSPVAPGHQFDQDALAAYIGTHLGKIEGPLEVKQFQGGQSNPTYLVTANQTRYVLRRKPPGKLLASAHAIDREYRVMSALAGTDVPVARMRALCEDPAVIGTAFYLMDYVEGRILWDPTLPGMTSQERSAHFDELNRVIAALHAVDHARVGLVDFGRTGSYIERQVARWTKQYQAGGADRIPAMDRLIEWLPSHLPADEDTCIVHGDYRLDNVIFHPTEPRILAVLDWELSTLGHPLSDFAYHAMAWRLSPSDFRGLKGVDLTSLGIPTEQDYVAAYCLRTGRTSIPHFEFYVIFNMFRIGAILHGVHSRALAGNASSQNAVETGGRARLVAQVAWDMVQSIDPRET